MSDLLDADLEAALMQELEDRATRASQVLQQAARQVLTGARSGRTYHRPGGGTYRASAPGEPPAERTGAFRASWQPVSPAVSVSGDGLSVTAGIATEGVGYGFRFDPALRPYIGGVAPRPFVDAILDLAQPQIEVIFAEPLRLSA